MARCPGCRTAMTRVQENDIPMHTCGGCFSTWIAHVALIRLTRQPLPDELAKQPLEELAALVTEAETPKSVRCPDCAMDMHKGRFQTMIPLDIHQCPKCKSCWLSAGKLSLLRRLYVEMRDSTDPNIVALREKIAQTNLEWEVRREQVTEAADAAKRMRKARIPGVPLDIAALIRMLPP